MQFRNSSERYGSVAIFIHWLVAAAAIGLFALGYWMVDLSYYDDWYRRGPDIHRSVGILLLAVMVIRVIWRFTNPPPLPLSDHQPPAPGSACRPCGTWPAIRVAVCRNGQWLPDFHGRRLVHQCLRLVRGSLGYWPGEGHGGRCRIHPLLVNLGDCSTRRASCPRGIETSFC